MINLIVCHDWFNLVIKFTRSNPLVLRGPKKLGTINVLCPKMPYLEGEVLKRANVEPHKRSFSVGGMYGAFALVSPIS